MFQSIREASDSGVIFETDFCGDVDDVGALAVLCGREQKYKVPLLGVSVNVNRPAILPAVDEILSFLGHKQLPMTVCAGEEERFSPYLEELAGRLPADRRASLRAESVTDFYRKLLANAPDHSVSIISVGFFCNMDEAMTAMPELFERKIRCIYAMAGSFREGSEYIEYNVREKAETALHFLRHCPCPLIFVPSESGLCAMTDLRAWEDRTDNPILAAYRLYTGGRLLRPSWDPITVDFAFSGENEFYRLSPEGDLTVKDDCATVHTVREGGSVRYMTFRKTDAEVGEHITEEIAAAAGLRENG